MALRLLISGSSASTQWLEPLTTVLDPAIAWYSTRPLPGRFVAEHVEDARGWLTQELRSGNEVLQIAAGVQISEAGLRALLRAWEQHPQLSGLSPLHDGKGAEAFLPAVGAELSNEEIEQLLIWLAPGKIWPINALAEDIALLRAGAETSIGQFDGAIAWLPKGNRERCVLAEPEHPEAPLPASLHGELIAAIARWVTDAKPALPAADDPVSLHVLHAWGGGVERWVRSLASNHSERAHLFLKSRSHWRDAADLSLHLGAPDSPAIAEWQLAPQIDGVALRHAQYCDILAAIVERYGVCEVIVSSLVHNALDAAATELPTIIVLHDYFPAWPLLEVDFSDAQDFGERQLAEALKTHRGHFFADADVDWLAVRARWQELLEKADAVVAPSQSVISNYRRLLPTLERDITLIPHGVDAFANTSPTPPSRKKPLLVVPGRLTLTKGKELLRQALPKLTDHCRLLLLGAGRDGMDFFGKEGVDVILDYSLDELPALIEAFAPDAALLPSTTAETFSFTLSELWNLGLPVIAARRGALAERVELTGAGILFEPNVQALIETVRDLDFMQLGALRERARATPVFSEAAMAERYSQLHPPVDPREKQYRLASISDIQLASRAAAITYLRKRDHDHQTRITTDSEELQRRLDWAKRLQRQVADRTTWAKGLERDLDTARAVLSEREMVVAERTQWAQSLNSELETVRAEDRRKQRQIEKQAAQLGELAAAMTAAHEELRQAQEDFERAEQAFQRVVQSRSWKITRPLRFAALLMRHPREAVRRLGGYAPESVQRTRRSLRYRGVRGTAKRIGEEFRKPQPPPLSIPKLGGAKLPARIPRSAAPKVSIIVPVFNHLNHTTACLASLVRHTDDIELEVIVVDDASSDDTQTVLQELPGLRYLRNEDNRGFIDSCNRGAAAATGTLLVFLNNDTTLTEGWLRSLVSAHEQPGIGLVGAKLVYPDGRLQEAGGIVFSDASGWNYGRFEDPSDPSYQFRRPVDYCSGACILIEAALFAELGGFDTRYRPAYYEDTDLAFAVRAHGLDVVYEPSAVVIHHEGVTSGTDLSSGTKRFQDINRQKFADKWKHELAAQHPPGMAIVRARTHRRPATALVIDACTPTPDQDSGSVRMTALLRLLGEFGFQTSFLPHNRAYDPVYTPALQQMGIEALYQPGIESFETWLRERGPSLDLVILSRHYVASEYVRMLRKLAPAASLVFDTVDLHYLRERRLAELQADEFWKSQAEKTRANELAVAKACDCTLVVSAYERELLAKEMPELEVEVLSNIHEVVGSRNAYEHRQGLFFVGGFQHPPNVDAVLWFVREIYPRVCSQLGAVPFHVVGSKVPPEIRALHGDGVVIHGFVKDIEPFLDDCRIAVAPLRYGAGVKGKVNMSMAYGQPVVATPAAIEGLGAVAGEQVLVANTAAAFADEVGRLYRDQTLWQKLSDQGQENVRTHFSVEAARESLRRVLARIRDLRAVAA